MGIGIVPNILVVGLELEISESLGPVSHGCPPGVQTEASTGVIAMCIPVLLAFCRRVLKVHSHRHVKRFSWYLLNVAQTSPKADLLK